MEFESQRAQPDRRPRRACCPSRLPRPGPGGGGGAGLQRHLLLDLGFHRLQLEVYGFNERAIAHAERVGFVREGVKRRAYRRHGEWADGVLFGLVREDLGRLGRSSAPQRGVEAERLREALCATRRPLRRGCRCTSRPSRGSRRSCAGSRARPGPRPRCARRRTRRPRGSWRSRRAPRAPCSAARRRSRTPGRRTARSRPAGPRSRMSSLSIERDAVLLRERAREVDCPRGSLLRRGSRPACAGRRSPAGGRAPAAAGPS